MEVLRIAENISNGSIQHSFEIPTGFSQDSFGLVVTDLSDLSTTSESLTLSSGDPVVVSLSAKYDGSYRIQLYSDEDNSELYDETVFITRPYVNPNTLGETASEISEATKNEEIARAIIDSVIPQGFYYKKETYETTGLGADYLPLWVNAKKILSVYENNVNVFDLSSETNKNIYEITKDKTAVIQTYNDLINRDQSAPNILPAASSDLLDMQFSYGGFPRGYDYRLVLEVGHTAVPSDIVRATKLLIEDISCGKLDYSKRYISEYNTDQFRLKFNQRVFEGTGNLIVDKILSKYAQSIIKLGVL